VTLFLRYQLSTKGKCELIYLEGFKFKAVNQLKVNHQDISGASVWQSPIVDPTIYRFENGMGVDGLDGLLVPWVLNMQTPFGNTFCRRAFVMQF